MSDDNLKPVHLIFLNARPVPSECANGWSQTPEGETINRVE